VDLDTFIVTIYCAIDDALPQVLGGERLRQRGPAPVVTDSEVLTMEVVGEFLGIDEDAGLYRYFRRHWAHFFPALPAVHRTTFVRQAANLWVVKERLWQHALQSAPDDIGLAVVDSFPMPVCRFARARRCRRFKGEAAFGKDLVARQTFYGFRIHVRMAWPGLISRLCVAPANVHELAVVPDLTAGTHGVVIGDRNYWSPPVTEELAQRGLALLAPYRSAKRDPTPTRSFHLSRIRYRIDTVFGQLVERYGAQRVWARDAWHLASRLLRKVLSHTLAVLLTADHGHPPLQLDRLVA
jgi:hypothetical protein